MRSMTPAPTHANKLAYVREIDGLRALAVVAVVLYHLKLGVPGGFVGVDIFFVISGFLITSVFFAELNGGGVSLRRFYLRRLTRIFPASLAVTIAVLIVACYRMLPSDLETAGLSAASQVLLVPNVFFLWNTSGYFANAAAEMPLLHFWSLGIEAQFYLLFPAFLLLIARSTKYGSDRAIRWIVSSLFLMSLVTSIYGSYASPAQAFYLLPARLWELLAGALIAITPVQKLGGRARGAAALLGVASMVVPMLLYDAQTRFPGVAALPPCVGAALFIIAFDRRQNETGRRDDGPLPNVVARVFGAPVPVFVGTISYSLYLCHWPILVLWTYWDFRPPGTGTRLGILLASVACAVVLWRTVEVPTQRRKAGCRKAGRRTYPVVIAMLAASLFVLGAAVVIKDRHGFPSRYSAEVLALDSIRQDHTHVAQLTRNDVAGDKVVAFGDVNAASDNAVFVWGDSHAAVALPAFNAVCQTLHLKGFAATHSSTSPLLDYPGNAAGDDWQEAPAYNQAVLEYITRHRIKTVFLVSYWDRDLHSGDGRLALALGRTLSALKAAGARVYVMLQTPGYDVDVPKALARESLTHAVVPGWRKSLADHRTEQSVMYTLAQKYEAADCHFIDPAPYFQSGHDASLMTSVRERSLYLDAHHPTVWGAKKVLIPFLLDSIARSGGGPATAVNEPKLGE